MKIKELKCKRFGGISDLNVKFTDAALSSVQTSGKSTLMEGSWPFFPATGLRKI